MRSRAPGSRLGWIALAALLLCACERSAESDPPSVYEREGLRFEHPRGWTVPEDEIEAADGESFRFVFIESPDGVPILLQRYDPALGWSIEQFTERLLVDAAESDGNQVELGLVRPLEAPIENGAGIAQSFVMVRPEARIPFEAKALRVEDGRAAVFLVVQAPAADWDAASAAFDLVAGTLELGGGS